MISSPNKYLQHRFPETLKVIKQAL